MLAEASAEHAAAPTRTLTVAVTDCRAAHVDGVLLSVQKLLAAFAVVIGRDRFSLAPHAASMIRRCMRFGTRSAKAMLKNASLSIFACQGVVGFRSLPLARNASYRVILSLHRRALPHAGQAC